MDLHQKFRVEQLYFKFIYKTPLEKIGWNASKLAIELAMHGLIRLVPVNCYIETNHFSSSIKSALKALESSSQIKWKQKHL